MKLEDSLLMISLTPKFDKGLPSCSVAFNVQQFSFKNEEGETHGERRSVALNLRSAHASSEVRVQRQRHGLDENGAAGERSVEVKGGRHFLEVLQPEESLASAFRSSQGHAVPREERGTPSVRR